jgi:hypothetical protein
MSSDREKRNVEARQWRAKHRDRLNADARLRRDRDREKINAQARARRAKDPEKTKVLVRAWFEKNPDKMRAYYLKNLPQKLLRAARSRAAKRELPFDIDLSDVVIPETCPVLGIKITPGGLGEGLASSSPTLDRIVNEKGYTKGNVIVVSWRANRLKNDATVAEMRAILKFYEALP